MKIIISIVLSILVFLASPWDNSMDKALEIAKTEKKLILLNFSGSDWCGPCIKLKEEVLNNPEFLSFSDKKLVLVRADFPRKKKNQISAEKTLANEKLAEKYNTKGKFPFTVLIDANGKVLKEWDGYEKSMTPISMNNQISLYFK
jgi:thioredoxin-related protein